MRRNPSFISRRKSNANNVYLTERNTGVRFAAIFDLVVWRVYVNESYDTFRHTKAEALDRIESEARIYML